jgi:MtN3 and saliva related transmembrane protein
MTHGLPTTLYHLRLRCFHSFRTCDKQEVHSARFAILSAMVKHPINKKVSSNFERFVLLIAIIEPLSTIPQIYDVFTSKNAQSLSLLSWLLFAGASMVWLVYGVKIKSMPLIASSILWITTEVLLMVGIVLYS